MKTAVTINPMGICAVILAASAVAACGGGSSGSGAAATSTAVSSGDSSSTAGAATVVATAPDSSSNATLDVRPASVQYAEAISTNNDTQAVLTSLASIGALVPGTTDAPTAAAASASDASTASTIVADAATANSVSVLSTAVTAAKYAKVADENHIFTVANNTVVRYGAESTNKWVTKTISGYGECTNQAFGTDPSYGVVKVCEVATTNTALLALSAGPVWSKPTGQMPVIDLSKIPTTPWVGFSTLRVQTTSNFGARSDIGDFRTECGIATMSFDDPIVFPGQVGKSHLHIFFGNTGANANSTPDSLRNTGSSTCTGGIANRSAYWVPAMIDTRTGAPVFPDGNGVYYKSGYNLPASTIKPIPVGLRMIAGNPAASTPASEGFRFACVGGPNNENDKYGAAIANCDVGAKLVLQIFFPQCWDGVNLDSPDHKSHMAYPNGSVCPSDHPVAIPAITFNVPYTVTVKNQPLYWRLASDNYDPSLPGGYSAHGDWFNGWKSDVSDDWAKNCLMAVKDCQSDLLGDGTTLY